MSESTQRGVVGRLAAVSLAALAAALLASCAAPPQATSPIGEVTVTAVPAGLLVEWTGGEGADGFVVYRAAAGEELAQLADVPAGERSHADYTATPGTSYTYAVAAVAPGTPSTPVPQQGEPVQPLPGVRLSLAFDGSGAVVVDGPAGPVACRADCVVGLAPGVEAVLSGEGSFAGFGEPCPPTPSCALTLEEDATVTALFRAHVLRLTLDGDAAAQVSVSPPDDRGLEACEVRPGADCLLGFTFTPDRVLQVSVNAAPLDAGRARLLGLHGGCEAASGFCVADVLGTASVQVVAAVTPMAVPDAFVVRGDTPNDVDAPGVLANDDVGSLARAELVEFAGPGQLELAADGSFTYVPPKKPPASVTFTYRLRGAHDVAGPPATVQLDVVPAPTAAPDRYTTPEDTELVVPAPGVLDNDSYAGDVSVELTSADGHGEVALAVDGSFSFRPARDAVGPFKFRYVVRNALGVESKAAEVTVTVSPVNDPPTFELSQDAVTGTVLEQTEVKGFAREISPGGGPDEAKQRLDFVVERVGGDPVLFVNAPSVSPDGTLRFRGLTPGTVTYRVVLRDDGGGPGGGKATSEPRTFTITVR